MKLYKRGSKWYADLRAEGLGRVATGATEKTQARSIAKRLVDGGAAGKRMADALTESWEQHYRGSKGQRNAQSIHHQLMAELGDTKLDQLTTPRIKQFIKDQLDAGISGATVNRKLAHLGKTLKLACEWGWLDHVPHIPRQKEEGQRHRELTDDELTLLMYHGQLWFNHLVRFLLDTGARLSEALNVNELDRQRALATGDWRIPDTKSGKPRTVPLTALAKGALHHWMWKGMTTRQCQREWDRVRDRLGLKDDPGFVIHCLRHTCASKLVQGGMALEKVQLWLGHGTVAVTQRYAYLSTEQLREGVTVLESVPSGKTKA